jgi:hypothetical protein
VEHIRGHVSIKFYISGYLMARRSKQQRPGSGKSNVGQAQASVSNILYIYFIIPILPNIPIATID